MQTDYNILCARLEQLEQDHSAIKADNASLRAEVVTLKAQSQRERRRLRVQASLAFFALLVAVLVSPANRQAIAQGYGVTLASLNTRVTALEGKTQYMSADTTARSTTFSGCNLFVNGGGGSTDTIVTNAAGDGLGNLIIGYNGLRNGGNVRTGSHNLILGDQNNYSSYGGLVAGYFNVISNQYSSVTGGYSNTASGVYASVTGGSNNLASAEESSVTGGYSNMASAQWASVSGGQNNQAAGSVSSVSGGRFNNAFTYVSSVSGGFGIRQITQNGWSGGSYHTP